MPLPRAEPFFLQVEDGRRFCLYHAPDTDTRPRGGVLAVHAFAEEMNKTRRAVADAARSLAAHGFAVLQIDLAGCGDSDGDFGNATWDGWLADLDAAWLWLVERSAAPRWLWGTRCGALLAESFAGHCDPQPDGLLFWQPVINGAQHLAQFLRLKTVNALLRDELGARGAASPRAELAAGNSMEIAGYRLNPQLADALERARAGQRLHASSRVRWLEVSSQTPPSASPAATRVVEGWAASGADARLQAVSGAAFWQTQEVERCDALVAATVAALCEP